MSNLAARDRNRFRFWLAIALLLVAAIVGFGVVNRPAAAQASQRAGGALASFRSDAELRAFLTERTRRVSRRSGAGAGEESITVQAAPIAAPPPASPAADQAGITNVQEAGVDEGGIVKNYRDMLVILRRGRLFTVSTAGGGLQPIDSIQAFPPGVSGRGDWYDEMLIAGDRVIVIGYSYRRGGTEVNRFRISPDGRLRFEDAYHLRSNDYYSSRNYASRLIGNDLIYYTPLYLGRGGPDPLDALPGLRKWREGGERGAFRRVAEARNVYIAPGLRSDPDARIDAIHSVTTCDLTAPELDCEAVAVLGPSSRTFYVSGKAVYLWTADRPHRGNWGGKRQEASAQLYRLPFAREEAPSAIGARGMPVDQFSFREDADGGRIDVLVRAAGGGDAMFRPEFTDGAVALLQVPIAAFNDGTEEADAAFYRDLPAPSGPSYAFHNRFVGDYVLYGSGAGGGRRDGSDFTIFAAPVHRRGLATRLALDHAVDRIEALGGDALVVGGSDGDLGFTAIDLNGRAPRVGDRYVQQASGEGESRSHAFFYSPDPGSRDGASGTLGLPIAKPVDDQYRRFFGSAAAMLFLRRDQRRFSPAGELDARPAGTVDDACQASCVDWYGNARPIFMRGRIFALLGYELVEGRMAEGRISEVRRTNFAPRFARLDRPKGK